MVDGKTKVSCLIKEVNCGMFSKEEQHFIYELNYKRYEQLSKEEKVFVNQLYACLNNE